MDYLNKLLDDVGSNPLAQAVIILAVVAIRVIGETKRMQRRRSQHRHRKGGSSA